MRYRALVSFSGLVSMCKGEERVLNDEVVIKDLIQAGYIEPVEKEKMDKKPAPKKATKKVEE